MSASSLRARTASPGSRPGAPIAPRLTITRLLSNTHRWLGIAMGLFFAMWFASGAVMLFIPFPELTDMDRYRVMPPIDMTSLHLSPAEAAAAVPGTGVLVQFALIQGPGGPIYVAGRDGTPLVAIDAVHGGALPPVSPLDATRIAERFAHARGASLHGPYGFDQWIVHQRFNLYRPLYRVDMDDEAGTHLYVSARTGDVVQRTTHRERFANYLGSVVHWIYPTVLRRYPNLWFYTVWAISIVGIAMAISGLSIGIARSSASLRRRRNPSISPFRKLFRWHHVTGLSVGAFLLAWIFSGWLSVDHGLIFPTGSASDAEVAAFRGITLEQAAQDVPLATMAGLTGYAAISLDAVAGQPILSGHRSGSAQAATWNAQGQAMPSVPFAMLAAASAAAWPGTDPTVSAIRPHDAYAHLIYSPLPKTAVRVRLHDARGTWVHVDAVSGRILELMDWRRRLYRWLFNGLHTFDFAGLADHDILRKILMLPLLSGGFLLSLTGVAMGAKRLLRRPRR